MMNGSDTRRAGGQANIMRNRRTPNRVRNFGFILLLVGMEAVYEVTLKRSLVHKHYA
jgi:hypothetical protein